MARQGLEELARVPIFSELTPRQLRRVLRSTEEYRYADGGQFVREGARSEQLFVILEGSARVIRRGKTVATLGPGDFFGEISLLDGLPRTATVVADGDVRCLILLRSEFERIVTEMPQVGTAVMRSLARRLREMNRGADIVDLVAVRSARRPGGRRV
jgi:CRP/FNR family transcriptional regulator, cyclic AMP receptor protein